MAEALAVVGIVANIIQIIDFGSRALNRLEEYQSKLGDIPETFAHTKVELPVLLDALRKTQTAINAGSIGDESKQALLPAIEGCGVQIRLLNDVIAKALPATSDSWIRRGGKAFRSLRYDAKVERITSVIRGYIQTLTFHATAFLGPITDKSPYRPTPSSTVPFRRDPRFVDRPILAQLDSRSRQPASRLALVGLGGVGKSQLAVEHSYRIREISPTTWVFWVHASSTARFLESYRKIAERAKLPRWDQPDVDILVLVYGWLCDEANGRWLMIIDNADDAEVFTSKPEGSGNQDEFASRAASTLLDHIPQSSNGSILITSRSRDVAFRLTGDYTDIVTVCPMDQEDALTLLRNQLKGSFGHNDAELGDATALVEALDYMPLAISQAAAYINQRAPRATVSRYLQDLRKGDQDRAKLLKMDLGDTRRDGTASNSVIATWQISFDHIHRKRLSATRLLSLMSLFNRQGIPEALLAGSYHEDSDADADFEDDLNTLLSFSLVATDLDGRHFQMHRLVQFSTTKWLELHGELDGWKGKYATLMDSHYPDTRYENWETCQALFPHAQAALAYRPTGQGALDAWTCLLSKAMDYASEMGHYQAAEEMGRRALETRETILGTEHPDTLFSLSLLAQSLRLGGKYEEAEVMVRRVLKAREKILGPEDPLTLMAFNNLGVLLLDRGDYEGAERVLRQTLQAQEKIFGPEHQSTLSSVGNLGFILTQLDNYEEAELLLRRELRGKEKIFGLLHYETLSSMDRLGLALRKQGKLAEAETMLRRSLEVTNKSLGEKHPRTLICAGNLASVLALQARHSEAESMHRRVLDIRIKLLGSDHPNTLTSMHNLALALKDLGCDQDAVLLMKQCFQRSKEILGPSHPDTRKSLQALRACENGRSDSTDEEDVEDVE